MDNEAPFTVGTDVNAQARETPTASGQDSAKNSVQVHVNDQTPLLLETSGAPGYGNLRPSDGSDDSETEPRSSWRTANVSNILLSIVMIHANKALTRSFDYCHSFSFICLDSVGRLFLELP